MRRAEYETEIFSLSEGATQTHRDRTAKQGKTAVFSLPGLSCGTVRGSRRRSDKGGLPQMRRDFFEKNLMYWSAPALKWRGCIF